PGAGARLGHGGWGVGFLEGAAPGVRTDALATVLGAYDRQWVGQTAARPPGAGPTTPPGPLDGARPPACGDGRSCVHRHLGGKGSHGGRVARARPRGVLSV